FLVLPYDFARVQLHRDDGVRAFSGGGGVRVSRSNIETFAFGIDCWRVPHGSAGWAPQRHSVLVLASRLRLFLDNEGPPDSPSRVCIERDDMAAERTAFVGQNGDCYRFHRGYRNVDAPVRDNRRTRDRGGV